MQLASLTSFDTVELKIDSFTLRVGSLEEHVAGLRRDLALLRGVRRA